MTLKLFKINYVDWTYRGLNRSQKHEQLELIDCLANIEFDICIIERVSRAWADTFLNECDPCHEAEKWFVRTANIDNRLGYTAGSLIISRRKNIVKNVGKIQLPSSKPQTDAGNPTYVPKFRIGETEILVGQMPQNLARDISKKEIDNYLDVIEKTFPDAMHSDLMMVGVYDKFHHEYDIHTWQINPMDAKHDDNFILNYIKNNWCIGIIETLNFWERDAQLNEEPMNFEFCEIYEESMKDPVTVCHDCINLEIKSYPIELNSKHMHKSSVIRMFEIKGLFNVEEGQHNEDTSII